MGRYAVALDAGRLPTLAASYDYRWGLIGNLGVDLAVYPLSQFVGLELATKIVVSLIPVLTVAGMLALARVVHGRVPATALFAPPLALGWPFQLGFVNFCLALAIAFPALALWIAMRERPLRRAALFVPVSWALWIAHAVGWGMFGLWAFGAELALRREAGRGWSRAIGEAGLACLALATPLLAMLGSAGTQASSAEWFVPAIKLAGLASMLRDRWMALDLASVALLLVVLGWGGARLGVSRVLAWPALLTFGAFLAFPHTLLGGAFADVRLAPYALALGLLAIRPTDAPRVAAAGLAFVALRLAAATASMALYAAEQERELAALDALPRGASVLGLVHWPCAGGWGRPRTDHLPSMAIVRRGAFANDQWAMPGQQLLTVHRSDAAPYDRDPSQFATDGCDAGGTGIDAAIAGFPRGGFTHVWTIGFPPGRARAADLALVWRSPISALYRVSPPAGEHRPR